MSYPFTTQQVNRKIKEALQRAYSNNQGPFYLHGNRDGRVTLCRKMTGILKGEDLPYKSIGGWGAQHKYPRQLFVAALEDLKKELGYEPFQIGWGYGGEAKVTRNPELAVSVQHPLTASS